MGKQATEPDCVYSSAQQKAIMAVANRLLALDRAASLSSQDGGGMGVTEARKHNKIPVESTLWRMQNSSQTHTRCGQHKLVRPTLCSYSTAAYVITIPGPEVLGRLHKRRRWVGGRVKYIFTKRKALHTAYARTYGTPMEG